MFLKPIYKKSISYIVIIFLWQLACEFGLVNTTLLPSPFSVFLTLVQLFVTGSILEDIFASLWRVSIGFILAALLGIVVGFATSMSKQVETYVSPIIEVLRPIPPIAFVPISILWFGIGNGSAYFLVCFGAFFPIFTNTFLGVNSINPIHKDAALCLGAKQNLLVFDVILPAAMPYITTGLKTGLGVAWFCVIVAELVGAQSGLGYMIQLNRLTLQSEKVIAGMIIIGVIGYFMNQFMTALEKKMIPWNRQYSWQ
jgi:NitT/TauT family transport system permease protein/sulfonate transport system permease protein